MKLTNNWNLLEVIVNAVAADPYTKGDADISVSELWSPLQKTFLTRHHWDILEEDAADRIWSLLGQATHTILERAATVGDLDRITEERFFTEFEGVRISGQTDTVAIHKQSLGDYKVTSVWQVINFNKGSDRGWEQQLNTYRWLLARQTPSIVVNSLQVHAILRDWSKQEAKRNLDYPRIQVATIDIPVWPLEETEARVKERVALFKAARDGHIPPCTAEETWEKPDWYAVKKSGREKAVRVLPTHDDAEAWIAVNRKPRETMFIEHRPGTRVRCESYCAAAPVCPQWKKYREDRNV